MARSAVLAGRTAADAVRNVFVISLMIAVGYAVDFRFQGGFWSALGAMAVALLFGYAWSWFFALIGMLVRDPQTAQVAGFVPLFPLVFASSIFVSTETMPSWLQTFAENQPVSRVDERRARSRARHRDDLGRRDRAALDRRHAARVRAARDLALSQGVDVSRNAR